MAYHRKPVKAPRLSGAALRMTASLLEHPATAVPLHRRLLRDLGIAAFRAAPAPAAPAFTPVLPAPADLEQPAWSLDAVLAAPPPAGDFRFERAADFARAYRDQARTPVDVAERLLAVIAESDAHSPPLRILIAQDPDDLLRQARASAERYEKGAPLGPLDGVPVAVKDEIDQVPYPTTGGTRFLGRAPAAEDAASVARLRQAGALLFGKANLHEIGIGVTGLNPHHGTARNPYDLSRHTGGSSSGVAAAIAAGLCPIGLGGDGGGSIRTPASFCGVVGLKPTYGRVPDRGALPLCWSVGHLGPLGATAQDCALAYLALAGPDPKEPAASAAPRPELHRFGDPDLSGLVLGIYRPWFDDAEPAVVEACRGMLRHLEAHGAQLREIEIEDLELLQTAHLVTIASEMAASQEPHRAQHEKDYGLDVRLNLALGRSLAAADYVHAQRHRAIICARFAALLEEVDVIVTPTNGCVAPRINPAALTGGESHLAQLDQVMRYVRPANLTGLPAISFPAGYDEDGMPVGFQAMGRPYAESLLLRLAAVAEGAVPPRAPRFHRRLLGDTGEVSRRSAKSAEA